MNTIEVVAAIIIKRQQIFIARRPANKPLGGLWEFPGGKIEANESPFQALKRELKEELDIDIVKATLLQDILDGDVCPPVNLHFFQIDEYLGHPKGHEGQEVRWVKLELLANFNFPTANQSIIQCLHPSH